ncbi:MAG: hypothetical protein QOG48_1551, partial [Verrucomicrobiota bacterium]
MRALILFALLLSACDTLNIQQYRITGDARRDAAKVKHVLGTVASQIGLADRTSSSRAPHTVVFYTQPEVRHFAIELGAREAGGDILVDLSAGFGPTPPDYVRAEQLLAAGLAQEFGARAIRVEHPDSIHT